jgi:hypothetical protein
MLLLVIYSLQGLRSALDKLAMSIEDIEIPSSCSPQIFHETLTKVKAELEHVKSSSHGILSFFNEIQEDFSEGFESAFSFIFSDTHEHQSEVTIDDAFDFLKAQLTLSTFRNRASSAAGIADSFKRSIEAIKTCFPSKILDQIITGLSKFGNVNDFNVIAEDVSKLIDAVHKLHLKSIFEQIEKLHKTYKTSQNPLLKKLVNKVERLVPKSVRFKWLNAKQLDMMHKSFDMLEDVEQAQEYLNKGDKPNAEKEAKELKAKVDAIADPYKKLKNPLYYAVTGGVFLVVGAILYFYELGKIGIIFGGVSVLFFCIAGALCFGTEELTQVIKGDMIA